jgi:ABC-type glycerol-3-phosphate transport system substrate-binding protein
MASYVLAPRRPTRRRVLAGPLGGAGAIGAAALLGACGIGSGSAGTAATEVSKPVTITAWYPVVTQQNFMDILQPQTDLFQQANPKVKVNVEPNGTAAKLQSMLAAGDPPDFQQTNYLTMFDWARQGVLEPIDAYLDRRGKGDFFEFAQTGSTFKGKMYEWPWMMNPTGVVANVSHFAERGATQLLPKPGPNADWTFDQWRAALRAVARGAGGPDRDVYGTGFIASTTAGSYWQMMFLWSNGAELYDAQETRVTLCVPQAYEALQMLVDVQRRERLAAPEPEKLTYQILAALFSEKRLGLLNASPGAVGTVERQLREGTIVPPLQAQFYPCPHAPGKKSAAFIGLNSFLVFRQDKDADRIRGAMQLGFHLTDTPAQRAIAPIGQLPVRKSVGNLYPDDPSRTTALASINIGRTLGTFPGNNEINRLWLDVERAVLTGQQDVKSALDEMCRLAEPIMARTRG